MCYSSLKKLIILKVLRFRMTAQFNMATKTRVSSESLILMLKEKILSGPFTLSNYLSF
jgi:hypothetical protein